MLRQDPCSVANILFGSCQRAKQILATECSSCRAAHSEARGEGMGGCFRLPLTPYRWGGLGVSPEKLLVEWTQNGVILHTFEAKLGFL